MSYTDNVIHTIGAMQTLIENFPMSLLDLYKGKTYTSVFEFLIDILQACGVNINSIIESLIETLYGVKVNLDDIPEFLENLVLDGVDNKTEQSEFLKAMEANIKLFLMLFLTKIFTCSAIPELPNRYMDKPCYNSFFTYTDDEKTKEEQKSKLRLWMSEKEGGIGEYPLHFLIPISYIDPMGIFDVTPTTSEGRLYYRLEGGDVYYQKISGETQNLLGFNKISKNNPVNVFLDLTETGKEIIFKVDYPILENITISVGYISHNNPQLQIWTTTIEMGNINSNKNLFLTPTNKGHINIIKWITINGQEGKTNDSTSITLSKKMSEKTIKFWNDSEAYSLRDLVKWGDDLNDVILSLSNENYNNLEYYYKKQQYSKNYINATRLQSKPSDNIVTEKSPDFIVVYEGENPNELYKSYDMNAFLWYCIKKGSKLSNTEINHMMWDNRLTNNFINPNEWYNSKLEGVEECEFNEVVNPGHFPILQVKPVKNGFNALDISFPAQKYFKPKLRYAKLNGNPKLPMYSFTRNASIFTFNQDYLESIQILDAKQMLAGTIRYLLGYIYDVGSTLQENFTKKIIEQRLYSAVKNVVSADDMEVEDCYFSFSNDDFNFMLEEMNLAKYNATRNNDTTTTRVHDVKDYINQINNINNNANSEGTTATIKKLINDVTYNGENSEYEIAYGFNDGFDGELLKKLIWAISMPIIESIFSPQVMLLIMINLKMAGLIKFEENTPPDFLSILNIMFKKLFELGIPIIKYLKDMIVELLLKLLYEVIMPLIAKFIALINLEKIQDWLDVLLAALASLPNFKLQRIPGQIDDVNYADITSEQSIPESTLTC